MNCDGIEEDAFYFHLQHLPPTITANILTYLPWKQKIQLVREVLPEWRSGLSSSGAWTHVCIDHSMSCSGELDCETELLECITEYGRYFKNLTMVLIAFNYNLDDVNIHLLEHIVKFCRNLRTFRIDHPSLVSFYMEEVLERYVKLLNDVTEVNCYLHSVALCNITYTPFDRLLGTNEFLAAFLPYDKLTNCVIKLEICDFYDYSQPYESLCRFKNLKIIKIHIEVLNTDVILSMCANSLKDLYIVNSGSTINEDFKESENIDWLIVKDNSPNLRVHYIYQERTIQVEDIVDNELVHSVVLDSLCNPMRNDVILTIVSNHGKQLQTFAHLATYWDYKAYSDDFDFVGCFSCMVDHCKNFSVFIMAVQMSCAALMEMAELTQFNRILVNEDELLLDFDYCCNDELNMDYFHRFMDDAVGPAWDCAPKGDIFNQVQYLYKL